LSPSYPITSLEPQTPSTNFIDSGVVEHARALPRVSPLPPCLWCVSQCARPGFFRRDTSSPSSPKVTDASHRLHSPLRSTIGHNRWSRPHLRTRHGLLHLVHAFPFAGDHRRYAVVHF
jgi:hypothetical protein